MAAGLGFEPRQTESESAVLPLHNPALNKWCEQWDLNPYVVDTRPSNVPVCQFQHARLSRQQKELYHLCGGLSTYFLKNFVFFYTLLNSYKTAKNKAIYIIKIHKGNKSILMIFIPLINKF